METSQQIYPQRFSGRYRTIKDYWGGVLLLLYMFGSWIPYHRGYGLPDQAILIDLPRREAYIFGIILWPDELYYMTLLMIVAAMGLFVCTALFGRLWCGFSCPHTVITDLFVHIEYLIQGDRNARIKLDSMAMTSEKFIKKTITHIIWLIVSFLFGFGWVAYFYDVKLLFHDLLNSSVTSNGATWLVILTGTTYAFAGFLRQKVCVYMCPYGRFQSAMLDNDTILVTYNDDRGEPRGHDRSGDCIDCGRCVIACPMGIDIRNGLQMSCIGCGLCVDACDEVMEKINKPKGLIEYRSANSRKSKLSDIIFKPKVIGYSGVFLIATSTLLYMLMHKNPIILQIDKIHSPLFTITPDGDIRNAYNLHILNKMPIPQENLCLTINGIDGLRMNVQEVNNIYNNKVCFSLQPGNSVDSQMFLLLPKNEVKKFSDITYKNVAFSITCDDVITITDTVFYVKN